MNGVLEAGQHDLSEDSINVGVEPPCKQGSPPPCMRFTFDQLLPEDELGEIGRNFVQCRWCVEGQRGLRLRGKLKMYGMAQLVREGGSAFGLVGIGQEDERLNRRCDVDTYRS